MRHKTQPFLSDTCLVTGAGFVAVCLPRSTEDVSKKLGQLCSAFSKLTARDGDAVGRGDSVFPVRNAVISSRASSWSWLAGRRLIKASEPGCRWDCVTVRIPLPLADIIWAVVDLNRRSIAEPTDAPVAAPSVGPRPWQTAIVDNAPPVKEGARKRRSTKRGVPRGTKLSDLAPHLLHEWHPDRNADSNPDELTYGSNRKVWWRCPHGHEWQMRIAQRTIRGSQCPECMNEHVKGRMRMALAEVRPDLVKEWHPADNGALTPDLVSYGSPRKVWWRCSKDPDHVWQAAVVARVKRPADTGCPHCAQRFITDANSLLALHPAVAVEWDAEKNAEIGLTVDRIAPASKKKVWWRCRREPSHHWMASCSSRTSGNTGCPKCRVLKFPRGTRFATARPDLIESWDTTLNQLSPYDISYGSARKVWWRCPKAADHVWKSEVRTRTSKNNGCPFCASVRPSRCNNLDVLFADIAREWHPEKNVPLTPRLIVPGSSRKVWWMCRADPRHIWQSEVRARTGMMQDCPLCYRAKFASRLSLLDARPDLAAEWDWERNAGSPQDVMYTSSRKVWWRCPQNTAHLWQATVHERTAFGHSCPTCVDSQSLQVHSP